MPSTDVSTRKTDYFYSAVPDIPILMNDYVKRLSYFDNFYKQECSLTESSAGDNHQNAHCADMPTLVESFLLPANAKYKSSNQFNNELLSHIYQLHLINRLSLIDNFKNVIKSTLYNSFLDSGKRTRLKKLVSRKSKCLNDFQFNTGEDSIEIEQSIKNKRLTHFQNSGDRVESLVEDFHNNRDFNSSLINTRFKSRHHRSSKSVLEHRFRRIHASKCMPSSNNENAWHSNNMPPDPLVLCPHHFSSSTSTLSQHQQYPYNLESKFISRARTQSQQSSRPCVFDKSDYLCLDNFDCNEILFQQNNKVFNVEDYKYYDKSGYISDCQYSISTNAKIRKHKLVQRVGFKKRRYSSFSCFQDSPQSQFSLQISLKSGCFSSIVSSSFSVGNLTTTPTQSCNTTSNTNSSSNQNYSNCSGNNSSSFANNGSGAVPNSESNGDGSGYNSEQGGDGQSNSDHDSSEEDESSDDDPDDEDDERKSVYVNVEDGGIEASGLDEKTLSALSVELLADPNAQSSVPFLPLDALREESVNNHLMKSLQHSLSRYIETSCSNVYELPGMEKLEPNLFSGVQDINALDKGDPRSAAYLMKAIENGQFDFLKECNGEFNKTVDYALFEIISGIKERENEYVHETIAS